MINIIILKFDEHINRPFLSKVFDFNKYYDALIIKLYVNSVECNNIAKSIKSDYGPAYANFDVDINSLFIYHIPILVNNYLCDNSVMVEFEITNNGRNILAEDFEKIMLIENIMES